MDSSGPALGGHGIQHDTPEGRQQFERLMEARRLEEIDEAALKVFRRGWCLGSEGFRERMLQQIEGKLGEHHSGELRRESAAVKAERILAEELPALGWTQNDLAVRRKSDPAKLAIAARLRKETTLSIKEIAARVQLGTSKGANSNLPGGCGPTRPKIRLKGSWGYSSFVLNEHGPALRVIWILE